MQNLSGTVLEGIYELLYVIGEGATSTVYLANDLKMGASWAIKVVAKNNGVQNDLQRQKEEAMLLSKLSHSVFPRVLPTIYENEDALYIVMDYVTGITLTKYIESNRTINQSLIFEWIQQLSDGLAHLHDNGFVYCDLKPDNIIISNNQLKVVDFGACLKIGDITSVRIGNKGFSSPEFSNRANPISEAFDIYSVGKLCDWLMNQCRIENDELSTLIECCVSYGDDRQIKSMSEIVVHMRRINRRKDPMTAYRLRLAVFSLSVLVSLSFFISGFSAYFQIRSAYQSEYHYYMNEAIRHEQKGEKNEALEAYLNATIRNPEDQELYEKIFDLIEGTDANKIDLFRQRIETDYLSDNLKLRIAMLCLEQSNPVYETYASELLKNVESDQADIMRQIIAGEDPQKIISTLKEVIENNGNENENESEELSNLYLLVNLLNSTENITADWSQWIEKRLSGIDNNLIKNSPFLIPLERGCALGLSVDLDNDNNRKEAIKWWSALERDHAVLSKDEHVTMGKVYEKENNNQKALECYQAAINDDPNDITSYLLATKAALANGQNELAAQYYREIVNLRQTSNDSLSSILLGQISALEAELSMKGVI